MANAVRVWDLPTRIFHWALVVCVSALVITGQIGGEAMTWHFRSGYAVLSLLLFRIVWGVIGGRWSRFSSFLYSPSTAYRYLVAKENVERSVGHNPLGAISVFAFLGALLAQVGTGLVSDDEIATVGPLSKFVSSSLVSNATYYHKDVGKVILIALVILHVAAILFYLVKKRDNLIAPMIQGDKSGLPPTEGSRDDRQSRLLAAVVFIGSLAFVSWIASL